MAAAGGGIALLKGLEQALPLRLVNADAGVAHLEAQVDRMVLASGDLHRQ